MRCNDCNKFVSYGGVEAEVLEENIEEQDGGDAKVTAQVRVWLTCAECSAELKETTLDVEADIDHDCEGVKTLAAGADQYELTGCNADPTERTQMVDSRGRALPRRAQKTYYGADVTWSVKCARCDETFEIEGGGEEQASYFDEL